MALKDSASLIGDTSFVCHIDAVHHTLEYIEQMPKEEICRRRLMTYDFFHRYVKTGEARLSAIIDLMDERLRSGIIEPLQFAPGISSNPDSLQMYQAKNWENANDFGTFYRYKAALPKVEETKDNDQV